MQVFSSGVHIYHGVVLLSCCGSQFHLSGGAALLLYFIHADLCFVLCVCVWEVRWGGIPYIVVCLLLCLIAGVGKVRINNVINRLKSRVSFLC